MELVNGRRAVDGYKAGGGERFEASHPTSGFFVRKVIDTRASLATLGHSL